MKLARHLALALAIFASLSVCAQASEKHPQQQPGMVQHAVEGTVDAVKSSVDYAKKGLVSLSHIGQHKAPLSNGLEMQMALDPQQVKLSETRQIQATLSLYNRSKKLVQLEFPTTQRIEVTVTNSQGKTIVKWSEDETFTEDPGFVAINPGERAEYHAAIPTRDLVADQLYTIEGFFPKYPQLRAHKLVTPVK